MQIKELINTIINVMIIPILPVITAYIIAVIKKKTVELEDQVKNLKQNKYITAADNAAITAVMSVQQTYVDDTRKTKGFLTPQDISTALKMAKEKASSLLGNEVMEVLNDIYGSADTWLENKILAYSINLTSN